MSNVSGDQTFSTRARNEASKDTPDAVSRANGDQTLSKRAPDAATRNPFDCVRRTGPKKKRNGRRPKDPSRQNAFWLVCSLALFWRSPFGLALSGLLVTLACFCVCWTCLFLVLCFPTCLLVFPTGPDPRTRCLFRYPCTGMPLPFSYGLISVLPDMPISEVVTHVDRRDFV